ncbi:unnamed protein product [Blepharisma stoltei]|uniref:Uncharacterized protein n=1 Tax=Blepharisma stoltei TaxID=1481888 RepID=A0AAU9JIS0_9CILI|nr:unnamed protein product [Blepharisma stoltei]
MKILIIYDTESGKERMKWLNVPERLDVGTSITQLPNGELFCYGNSTYSGITLIIDCNFKYRLLPSGKPGWSSSAIYFNRNVYCFGGYDYHCQATYLSSRFDLIKKQWVNLAPMPQADFNCHR